LNACRTNQKKPEESKPEEKPISCPETYVDETTLLHIQTATSLIEGRSVALDDIIIMVTTIMRQLSIDNRKKITYVDGCHGKTPP
jgi:cystathionine beta-lyase family protein involved in aluminum resistance